MIHCHPMSAYLSQRACAINQQMAGRMAEVVRSESRDITGMGRVMWTRFMACSACARCEGVGERDVDRAREILQRMWDRFGRLELEYTDPEVKEGVRAERQRRRWAREKANR